MERLFNTTQERALIQEWLYSERTQAAMADKYAISPAVVGAMRRNIDGEYSTIMRRRVWNAIREWHRAKNGQPEFEQIELPGMPPSRRSILLDMIQKELEQAGEDKLERIYKAVVTA